MVVVGAGFYKMNAKLISTQVEVVVEVRVDLRNTKVAMR